MRSSASPLRFLPRAAELYPAKTAIVCGEKRFTYRDYFVRANRLGNALLHLGVRRGDRVAYLGGNCHTLLEAYYGVVQTGAVLMPLNIRLRAEDFAFMLNHAAARTILVDADFIPVINSIRKHLEVTRDYIAVSPGQSGDYWDYEQMLAAAPAEYYINPLMSGDDVAELFYTSGTTGKAKGVMLSHRNLYANAVNFLLSLDIQSTDVLLHTIPLFHVNGWGTPHAITYAGGTHIMIPRFEARRVLELVAREKVTICCMVPTMVNTLVNTPEIGSYDLTSLKRIVVGGASSPETLVRKVEEKIGCTYIGSYGLTEASPVITNSVLKEHLQSLPSERRHRLQAKAGLPVVGVEIRVINECGQEIRHDGRETGEVVVRGDTVMSGYWHDAEGTAGVIIDNWLHTGDMATMDEEGYLQIVDRKKDIIISGGENISSLEVENILYTHAAVLEVAVVGEHDEQWGEVPKAFIVLKPGVTQVSGQDMIDFCKARLAGFKVPRRVEFVSGLPKSGTGKIMKSVLKKAGGD
ncbi:MAG: long-chain-fatty-acid--CoA ligase [Peptococcaceae bacterium]|jgi:fatty-acyl-CoA synthase|nr:long-chain-fatty-acid--CoA ligase [Peptococcaceae bacterium]